MNRQNLIVSRSSAYFMGQRFVCSIGRGGIIPAKHKKEGDGATPAGSYQLKQVFYNPSRYRAPIKWAKPTSHALRWSDDSNDPNYNTLCMMPHSFSHERLWRSDPLYDMIITTNWNSPKAIAGKGSAIFVHIWRRPRYPTAGCIAFSQQDLAWIISKITRHTKLIITA